MAKIPVGATIAHAYRFAFGGFVNLVRLTWLPQVVVVALVFALLIPSMINMMGAMTGQASAPSGPQLLILLFAYLFMLVLAFVQIAAIARAALGMPDAGGWISFPVGKQVWRLMGAFLLFMLLFIGAAIAMMIVGLVLGFAAGFLAGTVGVASQVIAGVVALCVMLLNYAVFAFVGIRVGFLLPAVVIAEEHSGLRRSWALSKGSFWRMLAVALGIFLPIGVLEILVVIFALPPVPRPQAGETQGQFQAAILDWEAGLFTTIQTHWLWLVPVWAVLAILIYGLVLGAQCFAYRALTSDAPEA